MLKVENTKQVSTRYGQRNMQNVTIADQTGVIELPLWGPRCDQLQIQKTYKLTNLFTKESSGNIALTTTADSLFQLTDDIEINVEHESEHIENKTEGCVVLANTVTKNKCLQCAKAIDALEDELNNPNFKIKCSNCGAKQKVKNTNKSRFCKIHLKNEQNIITKLTISTECFSNFLKHNNMDNKTHAEIDDFMLDIDKLTVTHKQNSDLVTSMTMN